MSEEKIETFPTEIERLKTEITKLQQYLQQLELQKGIPIYQNLKEALTQQIKVHSESIAYMTKFLSQCPLLVKQVFKELERVEQLLQLKVAIQSRYEKIYVHRSNYYGSYNSRVLLSERYNFANFEQAKDLCSCQECLQPIKEFKDWYTLPKFYLDQLLLNELKDLALVEKVDSSVQTYDCIIVDGLMKLLVVPL